MDEDSSATELESRLLEGLRLTEEDRHAEAFEMLLGLEPDYPESPELLCTLGVLAAYVGSDGVSVDFFRRCLALEPTDPRMLVAAGSGLWRSGDPAAEPALRLAALTAPDLASARHQYGVVLIRSGLMDQGMEELEAACGLDPADAGIRRELAIAHLLGGRPSAAVQQLEEAVGMESDDADMRYFLALALLEGGETSRAAEELYPLGTILAEDGEIQVIISLACALEGWEEEAWLALSRAEAAGQPADTGILREAEEALETGEDAVRRLLLEELAPGALRERIFGDS